MISKELVAFYGVQQEILVVGSLEPSTYRLKQFIIFVAHLIFIHYKCLFPMQSPIVS